ncbi:MAG: class I tRNA ligase family protein, partial [Candidatus Micrarchaeota archaeon]|nr:class I tRNA ligase family protein [Candidatus Micrarchaeota archaeon]
YIATDQWFFNIQKIKKRLLKENEKVHWHPSAAASWQSEVLKNSPDWCISRQRYWGIPIPVWVCEKCHSEKVVGSLEELRQLAKEKENVQSLINPSNTSRDAQIHRPFLEDKVHLTCVCGGTMKKIPDVFDVWFDSSIAFRASLSETEFKELFPIDYIHEGKDQLRGWFSGLLKIGVLAYGKRPFDNIGVGGMLLS